jgi:hypothetical protein
MDANRLTERPEAFERKPGYATQSQGVDACVGCSPRTRRLSHRLVAAAGITPSTVQERVEQELNLIPQVSGPGTGHSRSTSPSGSGAC